MKKVFGILLIVLLVAGTAFAASYGNSVRVKSIVGSVSIEEANQNAITDGHTGLYELVLETETGTDSDNVAYYTSNKDISLNDVVANFEIYQRALTRTSESITLAVSAGQLAYTDASTSTQYSTDAVAISNVSVKNDDYVAGESTGNGASYEFKLNYQGVTKEVAADTKVVSFATTWTAKSELKDHPGTYTADLTLTYTIE